MCLFSIENFFVTEYNRILCSIHVIINTCQQMKRFSYLLCHPNYLLILTRAHHFCALVYFKKLIYHVMRWSVASHISKRLKNPWVVLHQWEDPLVLLRSPCLEYLLCFQSKLTRTTLPTICVSFCELIISVTIANTSYLVTDWHENISAITRAWRHENNSVMNCARTLTTRDST